MRSSLRHPPSPGMPSGPVRTCVRMRGMVVCALFPRFQLTVAAGERSDLLQAPCALAPEPGGVQMVGEVSLAAEAFGVHPGMRLGETLARCPRLTLIPPDPAGVADAWERLLVRLESIGGSVEPERPGTRVLRGAGIAAALWGHRRSSERSAARAAAARTLRHGPRRGLRP